MAPSTTTAHRAVPDDSPWMTIDGHLDATGPHRLKLNQPRRVTSPVATAVPVVSAPPPVTPLVHVQPTLIGPEVLAAAATASPPVFTTTPPPTSFAPTTDHTIAPIAAAWPPPAALWTDPAPPRNTPPSLLGLRALRLLVALGLVAIGAILLPPADGTGGTSNTTMQLSLVVAGDTRCELGPIDLTLQSTANDSGRTLSTRAEGFTVPAASGDPACSLVNDVLGLPSTDTQLSMTYISADRPGPITVRYVTDGGVLTVGDSVELALPAGSGVLEGSRNPITGGLTADLALQPFTTEFDIAGVGVVPVDVAIEADTVTGEVPPGPGLAAALGGLGLLAFAGWTGPRFTSLRQRIPGARWYGHQPNISVQNVTLPMVAAMAVAMWGVL